MSLSLLACLSPFILSGTTPEAVGDSLFVHGYYQEAAIEFQRQLAESPPSDTSGQVLLYLKLGLALGAAGELPAAQEPLRHVADLNRELGAGARMALAGFYAHQHAFALSRLELSDLLLFAEDSGTRTELQFRLGWLALQEQELGMAATCYEKAGRGEVAADVRAIGSSGMKNQNLAWVLSSLVPGAGEIYAGRPLTGILSFVVNGACIGGVVLAARADDWVTAAILFTTLFTRFYNGSLYNAADFCREFNQRLVRAEIERLSTRHRLEPDWFSGVRWLVGPDFPRPTPVRKESGPVRQPALPGQVCPAHQARS